MSWGMRRCFLWEWKRFTASVQKSLEKNSYGKTVTVKVSVEKDNSGKYGLSDTEMNKLEAAMFPTE